MMFGYDPDDSYSPTKLGPEQCPTCKRDWADDAPTKEEMEAAYTRTEETLDPVWCDRCGAPFRDEVPTDMPRGISLSDVPY